MLGLLCYIRNIMAERNLQNVKPVFKDKYYVYALCKPCGTPFYIGKGVNNRINVHFMKSHLKIHNHKNSIIKLYGNEIKREILCYFDCEDKAYEYEDWLIAQYSLESEGGVLTNYAKTRFEYSDRFVSDVVNVAANKNKYDIPFDIEFKILRLYFYDGFSAKLVAETTGVPLGSILGIVGGKRKCRKLYDKYVSTGRIRDRRAELSKLYKPLPKRREYSDEFLTHLFKLYSVGKMSLDGISQEYKICRKYLTGIFAGRYRPCLGFDKERVNFVLKSSDKHNIDYYRDVYEFYVLNKTASVSSIAKRFDIPYTTTNRILQLNGRYAFVKEYYENYHLYNN